MEVFVTKLANTMTSINVPPITFQQSSYTWLLQLHPSTSQINNMVGIHDSSEKLEGHLNCSICLDIFQNPKQPQCHHIYCQQWLTKIALSTRPNLSWSHSCSSHMAGVQAAALRHCGAAQASQRCCVWWGILWGVLLPNLTKHLFAAQNMVKERYLYCKTCEETNASWKMRSITVISKVMMCSFWGI